MPRRASARTLVQIGRHDIRNEALRSEVDDNVVLRSEARHMPPSGSEKIDSKVQYLHSWRCSAKEAGFRLLL
jgi:hypothetical protein